MTAIPCRLFLVALAATLLASVAGCRLTAPSTAPSTAQPTVQDSVERKTVGTVDDDSAQAFAQPLESLDREQLRKFAFGNRIFNTNWVLAPASQTAFDGLGPKFHRTACAACHVRDGRGEAPDGPDTRLVSMLIRVSAEGTEEHGAPKPDPRFGIQVQEQAAPGFAPDARVSISWSESTGEYDDGTRYVLRAPRVVLTDERGEAVDPPFHLSPRIAPPVFGAGLLEAVDLQAIEKLADPDDTDGDGISGRMQRVWSPALGKMALGRFGWKAGEATVADQVASALFHDLGITSALRPDEDKSEPEISERAFERLVFYNRTLAAPAPRQSAEAQPIFQRGRRTFAAIGCEACHRAQLPLGSFEPVPEWSTATISAYTDLLLHDMGPGLADGRPEYAADGREWRTPPLWGIGLVRTVNGKTHFLHDGRARNLEEAILWHGGEAGRSAERFRGLDAGEREALIAFLESI